MTSRRVFAATLIAAAGAGGAGGAGKAIADVTIETVIKTGDTPPGVESGSTVVSASALLGDGGHLNLGVTLEGPTVDSTNNSCRFAGLPGSLVMFARSSGPIPSLNAFFRSTSAYAATSRPTSAGHVPMNTNFMSGPGIDTSNDAALLLWNGVEHVVLMREGDPAPGFDPLLNIPLNPAEPPQVMNDGRFVAQMGHTELGPPFNRLWLYAGTPASLTRVIAWGEPVPAIPGTFWYGTTGLTRAVKCTEEGICLILAALQQEVGGVTNSTDGTYWIGNPESPTLLFREGGPVPGLDPANVSSLPGTVNGYADINDAGEALFVVDLTPNVGDTTFDNNSVVLFGTPGNLVVAARKGDAVPGLPPGVTFGIPENVGCGTDRIAIHTHDDTIFIGQPGLLRAVFRTGDPAPGYPAGYTVAFGGALGVPTFSRAANYVTRAEVRNDQGVIVGKALYVGDPVTGEPVLLTGAGMTIEVAPGDVRTVGSGTNDLPRTTPSTWLLNAQNQCVFSVNFTDGSSAVCLATITGSPGPFFELAAAPTVDDSSGNGDGLIDPAESGITLTIPLKNVGLDPSTGVSATLTSLTPTATVVSGTSAYANLAAGASGNNASAFQIALDPSHPCGGSVQLQLNVTSNESSNNLFLVLTGGESYATCAAFALGGPAIINDSAGNGDGFVDPGESIALTVPVAKIDGGGPSTAITGTLTSLTPTATVTTAVAAYPNLGPNDTANNTSPYVITLAPSHPCGAPVDMQLTVEADGGLASDVMEFRVPTGSTPLTNVTVSWAGPSIPIPDNDPVGISVNVPVSGLSSALGDLDLRFDALSACDSGNSSLSGGIAHLAVSHLVITLTSPQGTSVVILNQQGGSGNHLCDAVFDDEAGSVFPACSQPFSCSHRPFAALSAFKGEDPNGTWTLHVADVSGSGATNIGSLQAFSLLLGTTTCAGNCPADFDGNGSVQVLDIFAFLTDWFAGVPAAYEFGGTPGVPAIFAFLSAWFAGCP